MVWLRRPWNVAPQPGIRGNQRTAAVHKGTALARGRTIQKHWQELLIEGFKENNILPEPQSMATRCIAGRQGAHTASTCDGAGRIGPSVQLSTLLLRSCLALLAVVQLLCPGCAASAGVHCGLRRAAAACRWRRHAVVCTPSTETCAQLRPWSPSSAQAGLPPAACASDRIGLLRALSEETSSSSSGCWLLLGPAAHVEARAVGIARTCPDKGLWVSEYRKQLRSRHNASTQHNGCACVCSRPSGCSCCCCLLHVPQSLQLCRRHLPHKLHRQRPLTQQHTIG